VEESILNSTKLMLGVSGTAFDHQIAVHINGAFSTLTQLGLGSVDGFTITDDGTEEWDSFGITNETLLNACRDYVYLKTKYLFDPPTLSFHVTAIKEQIEQLEWRLTNWRDWLLDPVDPMTEV